MDYAIPTDDESATLSRMPSQSHNNRFYSSRHGKASSLVVKMGRGQSIKDKEISSRALVASQEDTKKGLRHNTCLHLITN